MQSSISSERRGLYFDDLSVGQTWTTPGLTVTEESIINFAFTWDPQPFHLDKVASSGSLFGELVGSGLQTLMLSYRLYYDLGLMTGTALAGLGLDEIRFLSPLRPGDTISVDVTILELRPTSKPDRGVVKVQLKTRGQRPDPIMTLTLSALVARRSAETA